MVLRLIDGVLLLVGRRGPRARTRLAYKVLLDLAGRDRPARRRYAAPTK